MFYYSYEFPVGRLWIAEREGAIGEVSWSPTAGIERETTLIERTAQQLREYFAGRRREFDIPLILDGTPFRRQVWQALREIPFGEVRTYGSLGGSRFSRAVGSACHNNPISIIVPCHRVVGARGTLAGYAGGLEKKEFLLELERRCHPEASF